MVKKFQFNISMSNRVLYSLISLVVLLTAIVVVYAVDKTDAWHSADQIEVTDVFCNQITGHNCGFDSDTTCATSGTCSQVCIGTDCENSWPDAPVPPPPSDPWLIYSHHKESQCTSIGGTVYSSGGNNFCRFSQANCPTGWAAYGQWSTTAAKYCDACASCTTGSHSWSNTARETCAYGYLDRYYDASFNDWQGAWFTRCIRDYYTCTATRTQIGCY